MMWKTKLPIFISRNPMSILSKVLAENGYT